MKDENASHSSQCSSRFTALRVRPGSSMPLNRSDEPRPPTQLLDPNGLRSVMQGFLISVPSGMNTKVFPNWLSVLLLPGLARPEQAIARRAANAAADSPAAATVGQLAVKSPPSEILLLRTPVRKVASGMPLPVDGSAPCSGPALGLTFAPVFSVALNWCRPLKAPACSYRSVK